jgi:hypothetical protein
LALPHPVELAAKTEGTEARRRHAAVKRPRILKEQLFGLTG